MNPDRYSRPVRKHGRNRIASILATDVPMSYSDKVTLAADWLAYSSIMLHELGCHSPMLRIIQRRSEQIVDQCDWQS